MVFKRNNQKDILRYFIDLPVSEDMGEIKQCVDIAAALDLNIDKIIKDCHDLQKKGMLDKRTWGGQDNKPNHSITGYSLTPTGAKALDRNWNQTILNIIFSVSAIVGMIIAIHQIYPLW